MEIAQNISGRSLEEGNACCLGKSNELSGYDSDETIVEDSIFGSDEEDDELHYKRLCFKKEVSLLSEDNFLSKNRCLGKPSPEIQCLHTLNKDFLESKVKHTHVRQVYKNLSEEEKSQSLLRNWLNDSVNPEQVTDQGRPVKNKVDLIGLKATDSEYITSSMCEEIVCDVESPEVSLLSTDVTPRKLDAEGESLTEEHSIHHQNLCVTNEMEKLKKEREVDHLTKPPQLSCIKTCITPTNSDEDEFNITDLLKPLSDPGSVNGFKPLTDILVDHDYTPCMDASTGSGINLSDELVTAINSMQDPASAQASASTQVQEEVDEGQLRKTCGLDEDRMQITILTNECVNLNKQGKDKNEYHLWEAAEHSSLKENGQCDEPEENTPTSLTKEREKHTLAKEEMTVGAVSEDEVLNSEHRAIVGNKQPEIALSDCSGKDIRRSQRICARKASETNSVTNHISQPNLSLNLISKKNKFGETRLHKAAQENNTVLVHKLIEAGALINAEDYAGWTPLHEASISGNYQAAKILLEAGADVNARGLGQVAPIHDAVKEGHYEVVQLLLNYGANPFLINENGKTAFEEAESEDIRHLLSFVSKPTAATSQNGTRATKQKNTDNNEKRCDISINRNKSDMYKQNSPTINSRNKGIRYKINNGCVQKEHDPIQHTQSDSSRHKVTAAHTLTGSEVSVQNVTTSTIYKQPDISHKNSANTSQKGDTVNVQKKLWCNECVKLPPHECKDYQSKTSTEFSSHMLRKFSAELQEVPLSHTVKEPSISLLGGHSTSLLGELPIAPHKEPSACVHKEPFTTNPVIPHQEPSACLPREPSSNSYTMLSTSLHKRSAYRPHKEISSSIDKELSRCPQEELSAISHKEPSASPQEIASFIPHKMFSVSPHMIPSASTQKETLDSLYKEPSVTSHKELSTSPYKEHSVNSHEKPFTSPHNELSISALKESAVSPLLQFNLQSRKLSSFLSQEGSGNPLQSLFPPLQFHESHAENLESSLKNFSDVSCLPSDISVCVDMSNSTCNTEKSDQGRRRYIDQMILDKKIITDIPEVTKYICSTAESMTECANDIVSCQHYSAPEADCCGECPVSDKHPGKNHNPTCHVYWNDAQLELFSQLSESSVDSDCTVIPQHIESLNSTNGIPEDLIAGSPPRNVVEETISLPQSNDINRDCYSKIDNLSSDCLLKSNSGANVGKNTLINSSINVTGKSIPKEKSSKQEPRGTAKKFSKKDSKISRQQASSKQGVCKRNSVGETQLHQASRKGDLALVKQLLESGINVNQKDSAGWTALHKASCKGFEDIILELLSAGADVNCKGLDGVLPIHDAVSGNHYKAVEILLQHGANPSEQDEYQETAFDKSSANKMTQLLNSYGTEASTEGNVSGAELLQLKRTSNRASTRYRYATREKCGKHQSVLETLQDTELRQRKLLSTELQTSSDADTYIEEMRLIQDVLNEIVTMQKKERAILAIKYRASVDSFKQGMLRNKIAKLAFRQKRLLQVVCHQKEVAQKIVAYQQSKRIEVNNGEKSSFMHYCNVSPEKNQISAVSTVRAGHRANLANGSTIATKVPAMSSVPDFESNQFQNILIGFCENPEINSTGDFPANSLASKGSTINCRTNLTFKEKPVGKENALLSSDSCSSSTPADLQGEIDECLEFTAPGNQSTNSIPVTRALNIREPGNANVKKLNDQANPGSQQISHTGQHPQINNLEEADISIASICSKVINVGNIWQRYTRQRSTSQTRYCTGTSAPSSELQTPKRQQTSVGAERRTKKVHMRELLKMGKVTPGEDVLEFKLQDYSHKASLLEDGSIRDHSGATYRDPAQWIKSLLGKNISVTWKYVINKDIFSNINTSTGWIFSPFNSCIDRLGDSGPKKVMYLGKELSHFIIQEDLTSLASQNPVVAFIPIMAEEDLRCLESLHPRATNKVSPSPLPPVPRYNPGVLQVKEILRISNKEFLPCDLMDQYWKLFMDGDGMDF